MPTKIEWADTTEGAVKIMVDGEMKGYHCTKVSEGCLICYGEKMNLKAGFFPWANGIPYDNREVEFVLDQKVLDRVMHYRKPRRIFWQSMGDLFHEGIPDEFIHRVFVVIGATPQHQHIILTKRPERALDWYRTWAGSTFTGESMPYPQVWLGVTAENQARADERIPVLLSIPAAVHFVSIEPMLGPVDLRGKLTHYLKPGVPLFSYRYGFKTGLDWVILGGETGPGARPVHPDWVRGVRNQCQAAGVPLFFKQWGEWWPYSQMPGPPSLKKEAGAKKHAEIILDVPNADGNTTLASVFRVGKKVAGYELDGREWNEYPEG